MYTMKVDEKNGTLHIERRLKSELVMLDPKHTRRCAISMSL